MLHRSSIKPFSMFASTMKTGTGRLRLWTANGTTSSSSPGCRSILTDYASSHFTSGTAAPWWLREAASAPRSPEFASQFFDAVCAGGVDSVPAVVADFLKGSLKSIYRSPIALISSYAIDYSLLTRSGISPAVHLIEATRGCSFKCSFCVIPSEVGTHMSYNFDQLTKTIDNAISTSPRLSFRRLYPIFMLLDNNFSDDREHMLRVCAYLKSNPRVRGWVALVTQNVLHDRELIRHLAASKCLGLFIGLESFDADMLRRYRKTQNLSKRHNVIDDIAYSESQGVTITYGYLFDPRYQKASDMESQIRAIAENPLIPMPIYMTWLPRLQAPRAFGTT